MCDVLLMFVEVTALDAWDRIGMAWHGMAKREFVDWVRIPVDGGMT